MLKFVKGFTKKFNIESFGIWLNASIKNRALFVYSTATLSILIRYVLYSLHQDSWLPNSFTFYSALFSYTVASVVLLFIFFFKSAVFGDYLKGVIDIDRIRENRVRTEKFRKLVVETYKAEKSFKIYSSSYGFTFSVSLMFLAMTSGTPAAATACFLVLGYNIWKLFNILYFARCMYKTPVPEDLQTVKPGWLLRLEDSNKGLFLMNGSGNVVGGVGSGFSQKVIKGAAKAAIKSYNYLTDVKNLPTIIKVSGGAGTAIFGLDYMAAEGAHRTSYATKAAELQQAGTYSPDPDTRSKAAALRRRGIDLLDCCEPNSKCLNSELVENKYELVRPYETKRYLAFEEQALVFEEKLALEKEKTSTFEKANLALEKEKLALEKANLALLSKRHSTID